MTTSLVKGPLYRIKIGGGRTDEIVGKGPEGKKKKPRHSL